MNNLFYDQMFNPQYVNQSNYHALMQQRYENEQNEEVAKVVKAFLELCDAASLLDPQHQQIAFQACLAQFAVEQRWK